MLVPCTQDYVGTQKLEDAGAVHSGLLAPEELTDLQDKRSTQLENVSMLEDTYFCKPQLCFACKRFFVAVDAKVLLFWVFRFKHV